MITLPDHRRRHDGRMMIMVLVRLHVNMFGIGLDNMTKKRKLHVEDIDITQHIITTTLAKSLLAWLNLKNIISPYS